MSDEAPIAAALPLRHRVRHGLRHPANWLQLIRFGLVGASGYVVNLGVYVCAIHVVGIDYKIAAVLAFLVSVASNFLLNRRWTFDARGGHAGFQGLRFLTVSAAAFGFGYLVLLALVEDAHFAKEPAQAVAIVAATPLNFLGQKLWSFRA